MIQDLKNRMLLYICIHMVEGSGPEFRWDLTKFCAGFPFRLTVALYNLHLPELEVLDEFVAFGFWVLDWLDSEEPGDQVSEGQNERGLELVFQEPLLVPLYSQLLVSQVLNPVIVSYIVPYIA